MEWMEAAWSSNWPSAVAGPVCRRLHVQRPSIPYLSVGTLLARLPDPSPLPKVSRRGRPSRILPAPAVGAAASKQTNRSPQSRWASCRSLHAPTQQQATVASSA